MRSRVRSGLTAAAVLLWLTTARAAAPPQLRLVLYANGFSFPVAFVQDPTDPAVQFVVEQGGRIRTLVSGVPQATPFLDVSGIITSGGERGLLGLAFPPDAATSHRFYVDYTDLNGDTVVARFRRGADPHVADPSSRFALMWSTGQRTIPQPFVNHNGGCLAFGPDGFLYVGMGDGGAGNDPFNNAQNPASLLGKILRIDVAVPDSSVTGFVVPPSNPFVSQAGYRPEIWDIGVRNPWRFSFDSVGPGATGALIIGDVGQNTWEEIDYEPAGQGGRNYGWVVREGANPTPGVTGITPAFLPMTDPVYQYDHTVGQSVMGGYVYRGSTLPEVAGRYFFADWSAAQLFSAAVTVDAASHQATFSDVQNHTGSLNLTTTFNVSSFGLDSRGELFLVEYSSGNVWRLSHAPAPPTGVRIIR